MSASLHAVPREGEARTASLLDVPVVFALRDTEQSYGGDADDLAAHQQRYGSRPSALGSGATTLVDALAAGGLTGRGGAHFPTHRKWRAAMAAGGGGTVVVNAAEGEPASAKDAALMQHRPHLVLDGLALMAESLGADDAVIWLHDGAQATHRAVTRALHERRAVGLPDPVVRVLTAPPRYLSGEATAVISAVRGSAALPMFVRDRAQPWGAGERPVLVNNAETAARVALVARDPAAHHRSSLVTVVSPDRRVVCEVSAPQTVADVVRYAWAVPSAPAAVLLGGYGGSWLPWSAAAGLPLDPDAMRTAGCALGAGVIAPVHPASCGLVEVASLMRYLADNSARQCGPCTMGLPAVADIVTALAERRLGRSDLARLDALVPQVSGRGACGHPDGALRMLASGLRTFADDVQAHRGGRCLHPGTGPVLP